MRHPGPTLADRIQDHLSAGTIGDVGRRQVDYQEVPVRVDVDMSLVHDVFFAGIVTSCPRTRHLDALAVDHRLCRTDLAHCLLSVKHQFNVMDGLEQEPSRQLTKPAIDCAPVPEVDRQPAITNFKLYLKLTEVTKVNSKNGPAIQLADLMIGAALEPGNIMTGHRTEGLDPDDLLLLFKDDQLIHMLRDLDFEA